jgi:hypothetical protein
MTKREREVLHSRKCTVEEVEAQLGRGSEKRFVVRFSLTRGELVEMLKALAQTEGVGDDEYAYLRNAVERSGVEL